VSTAAQDPACSLDLYDLDFLWNLGATNQNYEEGQFASAGAFIPGVEEAGASSIDTAFQTTWRSSGYSHQSFDFEVPGDTGVVIEQTAVLAGPDYANNEVIRDFQSVSQFDWSSMTSYSTPRFRCDSPPKTGKETEPAATRVSVQGSQETPKSRISRLDPLTCPHCRANFSSAAIKRFGSHLQRCQKQHQCDVCGKRFSTAKDAARHKRTLTACANGSASFKIFACNCGGTFSRKDGLTRHVTKQTKRSDDGSHFIVQVGLDNDH